MNKGLVVLLPVALAAVSCNNSPPAPTQRPDATPAEPKADPVTPEAPAAAPRDPHALDGDTHAVYDLLANRPLAHTHTMGAGGGAVMADGGQRSFHLYVQGDHASDWKIGVEVEGRRAAAMRKTRKTMLWMPAPEHGKAGVFEAEIFNPAKQPNELRLVVNGEKLAPQKIEPGWQTTRVEVPAGAMRAENAIDFELATMARIEGDLSGGALGKFRLGAPSDAPLGDAHDVAGLQSALQVTKKAGGAMWHVWALPKARVQIQASGPEGCSVDAVWWKGQGDGVVEAGRKAVKNGDTWIDFGTTDEVVRFSIVPRTDTCDAGIDVAKAALVLPGKRPVVPDGKKPKHILFWMVDTLRADHLPIHFDTDVQAPNLKKLAAEGASFAVSYVQGNESRVSHGSLFSGMYPSKHGIKQKGTLKPHHHILPEAIGDAGYKTYAFMGNGYVSEPWGFVQGWNMYRNNLREGFAFGGDDLADDALKWITKHKDESLFMYVGTVDPHVTYRRHDDIIELYDKEPYSGPFQRALSGEALGEIAVGKMKVTDRDKARAIALYKNEITFNDRAFGALRKGLEELGTWKDTMVVVTGDHGDQFWEHGGVGHGSGVHHHQVHVPLLVYYPPLIPAGTVVEAGVDLLDIYPTIMDALDHEPPKDLQGHSLLQHIYGVRGDYPEPAIATSYTTRYGVQMQHWKMISKNGAYELFDTRADPTEQTDLVGKRPLAERWLADTFSTFRPLREKWSKAAYGPASNLSPEFLQLSK